MADDTFDGNTNIATLVGNEIIPCIGDPSGTPYDGRFTPDVLGTYLGSKGWIPVTDTWTRTGNHTFTVAGDVTATYRKNAYVRYQDGGSDEYGIIQQDSTYSAPNTTVTLATNTDYAMAAATITNTYISYVGNPEGMPFDFAFTPTVSGWTQVNGTVYGKVFISSGRVTFRVNIILGSSDSITGAVAIDYPIPHATFQGARDPLGVTIFRDDDAGVNYLGNTVHNATLDKIVPQQVTSSGTYAVVAGLGTTVPFTWATSDEINCFGDYPLA